MCSIEGMAEQLQQSGQPVAPDDRALRAELQVEEARRQRRESVRKRLEEAEAAVRMHEEQVAFALQEAISAAEGRRARQRALPQVLGGKKKRLGQ